MEHTKIKCAICNEEVHSIQLHLSKSHPEISLEQYCSDFPDAPLLSEIAAKRLQEYEEQKRREEAANAVVKKALHEAFALGSRKGLMNAHGNPVMIDVLKPHKFQDMVPEVVEDYKFDDEELKNCLLAFDLNIPLYVWGYHGTGKTELVQQIASRTNRPMIRVQHTVSTEEEHLVGAVRAKEGSTYFDYGALALAMIHGWTYLADEYDFAMPNVIATYQAVLEGKPLIIKSADADSRVIKPHPQFRFVATGNTNGSGDESGLYQGTMIQNAASYDRFGVTVKKDYLPAATERKMLMDKCGISENDARLFVEFAQRIREQFASGSMGATISPRAVINAIRVGERRGNWQTGLRLAFINKLSQSDATKAEQFMQRVFGS